MAPGKVAKLIGTIKRKPTLAADGMTDEQAALRPTEKVSHFSDYVKGEAVIRQALKEGTGGPIDDRKLLLEHGVQLLQSLPADSALSAKMSGGFIGLLWRDLPHPAGTNIHPPSATLGEDGKFLDDNRRFRSADGSGNNLQCPEMGKAGTPYARSVPPMTPKPSNLPDPEMVYDQLLRRPDGSFKPHPQGLNRLFFSYATIVIHECFQTERKDLYKNGTSSYVDLSTLYGNNQEEQNSVRTFENGCIWPDSFASERLAMMPPAVVALMIVFSRNHNHIAERLLEVNEGGKYKPWEQLDEKSRKIQDENIFQYARNVNVGFFATVVLKDYVSAILATAEANSEWWLNLGAEIKEFGGTRLERGTGVQNSAEFNILYRWHAAMSASDAKWMEEKLLRHFPGKSIEEIGPREFAFVAQEHKKGTCGKSPKEWDFDGYFKRGADGRISDVQLGELIKDAIEEPAHTFGARGTPSALRVVDIMGQLMARNTFQLCTMNEFRRYLNLKPFETFEDWNSDKSVAEAAAKLYSHVDNLELYPGLLAEEAKPAMAGSGVCPGHTIGRAILDDAVQLIRGDRFLTYDFNASTLTNWGVQQLATAAPGSYGGMLPVLLQRALPNSFQRYSSYALLPFHTPEKVRHMLKKNKVLQKYDTARPPKELRMHGVHTHAACKFVWENRDVYRVPYDANIFALTGSRFMISVDDETSHGPKSKRMMDAFFQPNFEKTTEAWYRAATKKQIAKQSLGFYNGKRHQLDVIRDVCNVVPVQWLAHKYAIPVKTQENPHGMLSIWELQQALTALFIYSSFDQIPAASWVLRQAAEEFGPKMLSLFETRLKINSGVKETVHDWFAKGTSYEVSEEADYLYHSLIKTGLPVKDLAGDCLGVALPVIGNMTQQPSLLIDLFLEPENKYALDRIVELVAQGDEAADKELMGWVYEGMRVRPIVLGLPRIVAEDTVLEDGNRRLEMKAGDKLIINTRECHMDPLVFPEPTKMIPTRDPKSYMLLGQGMHFCFGARLLAPGVLGIFKEVFALKNIRRATHGGHLTMLSEHLGHNKDAATAKLFLSAKSAETPIPTSMKIEYDL